GTILYEPDLFYYHPNHLGSTSFVTDVEGEIYQHLEYFPFGETWIEEVSNQHRVPFLFTAKELDRETGLYYFGARYYDPRTSVWQSPDPILAEYLPTGDKEKDKKLPGMGGVFNSSNLGLYSYSHLNSITLLDIDGNQTFPNSAIRVENQIRVNRSRAEAIGSAVDMWSDYSTMRMNFRNINKAIDFYVQVASHYDAGTSVKGTVTIQKDQFGNVVSAEFFPYINGERDPHAHDAIVPRGWTVESKDFIIEGLKPDEEFYNTFKQQLTEVLTQQCIDPKNTLSKTPKIEPSEISK
ncbi:MAG: RHS repeat-associated core domain-containing protein, partial [Candidatus Electrothrix sp. EH2]|nr:RHS repeat-associated core domain-containing protein [Candidatus Electrothrix sp. EH2]